MFCDKETQPAELYESVSTCAPLGKNPLEHVSSSGFLHDITILLQCAYNKANLFCKLKTGGLNMFVEIKENISFGKAISSELASQVKAKQDLVKKLPPCKAWMVKWRRNIGGM